MKSKLRSPDDGPAYFSEGRSTHEKHIIERDIVASLLTLMILVSVAGCGTSGPGELDRHSIESMRGDFGPVGRSVISCPAGDCIIMHFPPTQAESIRGMFEVHTVEDTVNAILKLDDDDPNNDGEILVPEARRGGPADSGHVELLCLCRRRSAGRRLVESVKA